MQNTYTINNYTLLILFLKYAYDVSRYQSLRLKRINYFRFYYITRARPTEYIEITINWRIMNSVNVILFILKHAFHRYILNTLLISLHTKYT